MSLQGTTGCCSACQGTGFAPDGPCSDCLATGCAHAEPLCCGSVREDGQERCSQPQGHDGPHRGRLGTWVWREDDKRCPHQVDGARCMLKPEHVGECARLPA